MPSIFNPFCQKCKGKLRALSYQANGTHITLRDRMFCPKCNLEYMYDVKMLKEYH